MNSNSDKLSWFFLWSSGPCRVIFYSFLIGFIPNLILPDGAVSHAVSFIIFAGVSIAMMMSTIDRGGTVLQAFVVVFLAIVYSLVIALLVAGVTLTAFNSMV